MLRSRVYYAPVKYIVYYLKIPILSKQNWEIHKLYFWKIFGIFKLYSKVWNFDNIADFSDDISQKRSQKLFWEMLSEKSFQEPHWLAQYIGLGYIVSSCTWNDFNNLKLNK